MLHTMSLTTFACDEYEDGQIKGDEDLIRGNGEFELENGDELRQLEVEAVSPSCEVSWREEEDELEQEHVPSGTQKKVYMCAELSTQILHTMSSYPISGDRELPAVSASSSSEDSDDESSSEDPDLESSDDEYWTAEEVRRFRKGNVFKGHKLFIYIQELPQANTGTKFSHFLR